MYIYIYIYMCVCVCIHNTCNLRLRFGRCVIVKDVGLKEACTVIRRSSQRPLALAKALAASVVGLGFRVNGLSFTVGLRA